MGRSGSLCRGGGWQPFSNSQWFSSMALGALPRPLASCGGFSAGRRPSFWKLWKAQALFTATRPKSPSPCPPAKLPAHSSCIVIHQLSLCLLLRNTSQHLFQLCHPAISHRRHSRRHSKESHGALTTFLTPLTLQQPQRHPESTPAPFSSDILQPNGLLQRGPQPYLPPEAGSFSSN